MLVDDGWWNINRQHIGKLATFAGAGARCGHGNRVSNEHECYVDLGEPAHPKATCNCLFVRYVNLRRPGADWQRQETTTWDKCAWAPGRGYVQPPEPTQLEKNAVDIELSEPDVPAYVDNPFMKPLFYRLRWPR